MLDNAPLRALLQRQLEFGRIDGHVQSGALRALAINATSYSTGHAVTFYQGAASIAPWRRTRRRGEPTTIGVEHLLASTAIPFVFPAERSRRRLLRRRLGAPDHAAVTGAAPRRTAHPGRGGGPVHRAAAAGPSRRRAIRRLLRWPGMRCRRSSSTISPPTSSACSARTRSWHLVPTARQAHSPLVAHIDALVLSPSRDLGAMAVPASSSLPTGVRYLLHGLGSTEGTGASLLSYLLFEPAYTRALHRPGL